MKRYNMNYQKVRNKVFAQGSCGDSLEWVLTNGILHIRGIGEMTDYVSPWYAYTPFIERVIIDDNIVSVGDYAFYNCNELREILLSENTKKIGDLAFYSCSSLYEIRIPDTIETIKPSAFKDCDNLRFICRRGSYADGYASDKKFEIVYK